MADKKGTADFFANIAYLEVVESAANTLTFAQLQLATTLMSEKMALIIHRLEYYFVDLASFNSTGDFLQIALTVSNTITSLTDMSQPEILTFNRIARLDLGAAATGRLIMQPYEKDFTSLPGGGILVPADRMYLGIQGSGMAAACTARMRLYYTVKALTKEDFWDLIEARRIMST